MTDEVLKIVSQTVLEYQRTCRLHYGTDILSGATNEALRNLKFELIPHPPYSPDLTLCDFIFSLNEVKVAVKSEEFSVTESKNEKFVNLNGDILKN